MAHKDAVEIVARFWREVWQAKNPAAVDQLVAEDFVITTGGVVITPRVKFKAWVKTFLDCIDDFKFEVVEMFQSPDGHRVATRFLITGHDHGFTGLEPTLLPIRVYGTSIIEVGEDGLLRNNWVERNSLEVHRTLTGLKRGDN
jgi:SnoaL-like domain